MVLLRQHFHFGFQGDVFFPVKGQMVLHRPVEKLEVRLRQFMAMGTIPIFPGEGEEPGFAWFGNVLEEIQVCFPTVTKA